MDLGLNGRVALVLGAGGGLGSAIARSLAAEGAVVALADRSKEALDAAVPTVDGECLAVEWDLADLGSIDRHVASIESRLGPIDILVNITGGPPPTPVSGQPIEVWAQHFESMALSVVAITDRVLPGMKARGWGRIITSTSSGVIAPIPNLGLSNAIRSTLVGWSKTLAAEVGRDGITSNIIVPGRIATARITQLDEAKAVRENSTPESVADASMKTIPVGRYGDPEEYADMVSFLVSDRAAYVTGSVIRVDGGLVPSV